MERWWRHWQPGAGVVVPPRPASHFRYSTYMRRVRGTAEGVCVCGVASVAVLQRLQLGRSFSVKFGKTATIARSPVVNHSCFKLAEAAVEANAGYFGTFHEGHRTFDASGGQRGIR